MGFERWLWALVISTLLFGGVSSHQEFVGFTAWLQETKVYGVDDPILFEGVNINEPKQPNGQEGFYQQSTGRFFCPYNGVYFVSLNLRRTPSSLHLKVVKVGESVTDVMHLWDTSGNNDYITVSNSALLPCDVGEYIAVVGGTNSYQVYGEEGIQHSTFTVFLTSTAVSSLHDKAEGFTAYLPSTVSYAANQVVPFFGLIYNGSASYNPTEGVYTCPVNGTYFLQLNQQKNNNQYLKMGVSLDFEIILHSQESYTANNYHVVSNSRLVKCAAGQVVSVRGLEAGSIYGSSTYKSSTFSMVLLHEDGPEDAYILRAAPNHQLKSMGYDSDFRGRLDETTPKFYLHSPGNNGVAGTYSMEAYDHPGYFLRYQSSNQRVNLHHSGQNSSTFDDDTTWYIRNNEEVPGYVRFDSFSETNTSIRHMGSLLYSHSRDQGVDLANDWAWELDIQNGDIGTSKTSQKHRTFTGFSAYKPSTETYSAGNLVSFGSLLVNEGGAFDGDSFTCPVSGIYYVSVHFRKSTSSSVFLDVSQASITMFRSEDTFTGNQGSTLSNSGLFTCVANENIKVQAFGSGAVLGDPLNFYSTFSIFLLHEF